MMRTTEKAMYQQPLIEVIEVENEGVMASSDPLPNVGNGGSIFRSNSPGVTRTGAKHQSASPLQELEDMINDFLTF